MPYVKTSYLKNNFSEIINRDTFDKLLEIYNENQSNLRLEFNFDSTGTAKFTKLNNKELNEPKMIYNSYFGIKNTIRKIFKIKPKK